MKKNKILYFLLLLPWLSFRGNAQHGNAQHGDAQHGNAQHGNAQQKKSLIWEISGNDLEKPSYIFGTIHVICPEDIILSESTQKAFDESSQIYLELDLDNPELISQLKEKTHSKKMLKDLVSKKKYKKLDAYFQSELGFSVDVLGRIKPFYLLSYTYKSLINCDKAVSIESVLVKMGQLQSKEIYGLETLEQQTAIFETVSPKKQAKILSQQIRKNKQQKNSFEALLKMYKSNDIAGLRKATSQSPTRRLNKLLLKNRNLNWVEKIPTIAAQSSTFFGVGAAHLGGKTGLIHLLQKKGFIVKAL